MAEDKSYFKTHIPYQFYLPKTLKKQGMRKAEENNIPIAPFMEMAWEQFVDRPIEKSLRLLKVHKRKRKQKQQKEKLKGVTL